MKKCSLTFAIWVLSLAIVSLAHATPAKILKMLHNGGLRVEEESGKVVMSHREGDSFIPASTMKLATAFCALELLGKGYRFRTGFFVTKQANGVTILYVKGSGDPGLVSEEFDKIAQQLASHLIRVDRIVIDTSLFDPDIEIDGMSASTNPYDARNAAFVGNFSSALVTKSRSGRITSAEPTTPLTPIAEAAGRRLPPGVTERVNLGRDWKLGALYGGELLAAFLRQHGVEGDMTSEIGRVPASARQVYLHQSSSDLAGLVEGLLRYSTNFTANQLFLVMGIEEYGAPATVKKGQQSISRCLSTKAGWRDFHAEEGSGLSRLNRVSTSQMASLLRKFEPYKDLLHEQDGFLAKTGTLTGVNTLAGYFSLPGTGRFRFAILINATVPAQYKFTVAREIRRYIESTWSKRL